MAITQEEMLKIKAAAKEAEKSERPFPVVKDGEMAVVGDVNNIAVKKHDYTLKFRFPASMGIKGTKVDDYVIQEVEYKDVFINGQDDLKILRRLMELIPFFNKIKEDGSLEERTDEELAEIVLQCNDDIVDTTFGIVKTFLHVDDELAPFMLATSVFEIVAKMIIDHSEAWNEGDVFFG